MKDHAANHENNQRHVNPPHDGGPNRANVSRAVGRDQFRRQVNPARCEISARSDMTLPARVRQICSADHRLRIRGGKYVVNAMTARTVRHHFRAELRRKTVIAVAITTHALTRDSEFFRERYAFVTTRTSLSSDRRYSRAVCSNRWIDIVNPMTIGADRRARHATHHCLPVNTLYELRALALVTLAARRRNVAFGDGRLRIGSGKDVVTVMTVGTNSRAEISLRDRFCVHTLSIRKKRTLTDPATLHH